MPEEGLRQPNLTDNARVIFDLRYARKDEEGNPTETPADAIKRVAENVALPGVLYGIEDAGKVSLTKHQEIVKSENDFDFPLRTAYRQHAYLVSQGKVDVSLDDAFKANKTKWRARAKRYTNLLTDLVLVPNSPTWTGAGTPLGQYAACFVLPIEDDLGRTDRSIFQTMRNAALIQQTGGGNGFDFSDLRPKGAVVKASMGQSSGPVSFLKVYDSAFGSIGQGGTRRGANMGILRIDHPDINEFIDAKLVEGEIANFNISVAMTDEFMDSVANNDEAFDLTFRGQTYDTVDPNVLWNRIIDGAWTLGDPGVFFVDAANRQNPCPTRYTLAATNPCGEQALPPYSNCCLGAIAVNRFAKSGEFYDWKGLQEAIHLSVQFLDDVIDANRYVPDVPQLEQAAMNERRIGLGIMGLADALMEMGLAYNDEDGQDFTDQMMEFFRYHTMLASIERAKERGPFGWIDGSIYDPKMHSAMGEGAVFMDADMNEHHLWSRPASIWDTIRPDTPRNDFERPEVNWDTVAEGIAQYGIRNACQTTIAPTGTTSNIAGLEGSGCEPLFALAYQRRVMQEGENIVLDYLSPMFERALDDYGITNKAEILAAVMENNGSCQGVKGVPAEVQRAFVVASDIAPAQHVEIQAICQAWIDNAISKTINLPNEATREDVADIYRMAWELGCKGTTVYRQGSRDLEVLSTKPKGEKVELEMGQTVVADRWPVLSPMSMPDYVQASANAEHKGLPCRVFEINTAHGTLHVYVTELRSHPGRPFDVRLQIGKAGNDKLADVEAIGRSISVGLRTGVDVNVYAEQLEGLGGKSTYGFGPNKILSVADGVSKLLKRLYGPNSQVEVETSDIPVASLHDTCPNCQNATVVYEAGCAHCDVRLGGCGVFSACD